MAIMKCLDVTPPLRKVFLINFLNGSTLKLIPHSRDMKHKCFVEPSFHITFVLTYRLYNYTHHISNIPYFPPHNTQFYPEKVTNYHPAS